MKLLSVLFFVCPLTSVAQQGLQVQGTSPLYIIRVESSPGEFEITTSDESKLSSLDPSWIKSISVVKGPDATAKYGDKGTDGVVIVTISREYADQLPDTVRLALGPVPPKVLFVLQKTMGTREFQFTGTTIFDMDQIDPAWIESITVIKDEVGKKKYGEAGINGVVVIRINSKYIDMLPEVIRTQLAE